MTANGNAAALLAGFTKEVKERHEKINSLRGKEAENSAAELSRYIAEQTQLLMKEGLSVTAVQNSLRAATDCVPQTYAPDADIISNDEGGFQIHRSYAGGSGGKIEAPVGEITYFLPLEKNTVAGFAAGKLDAKGFAEILRASPDITPLEMTEEIELVLTAYGKNQSMDDVVSGGEVVAGPDGEAFMPEHLDVGEEGGYQFSICDPMVYKSPEEVKKNYALLEPFTEKEFLKKVNINKIIKAEQLEGEDKRLIKKAAVYIKHKLWDEFSALRETYRRASDQEKGIAVFVGYEGEDETDSKLD